MGELLERRRKETAGRIEKLQKELTGAKIRCAEKACVYEQFLEITDASEEALLKRFLDKEQSKRYVDSAYGFGDLVAEALEIIGQGSRFYRLLVV